jgi:hypothetical protein
VPNPPTLFYAGIGSRQTPGPVLDAMFKMGSILAQMGFTLRSGGAVGADTAFERGAAAVYGPRFVYKGGQGPSSSKGRRQTIFPDSTPGWRDWAEVQSSRLHPKWQACPPYVKRLHRSSMAQICGHTLPPQVLSHFVLCWTPDGAETAKATSRKSGGTGQAIRIADAYGVPTFNLNRPHTLRDLGAFLEEQEGTREARW